jgi:hypothetical protein
MNSVFYFGPNWAGTGGSFFNVDSRIADSRIHGKTVCVLFECAYFRDAYLEIDKRDFTLSFASHALAERNSRV